MTDFASLHLTILCYTWRFCVNSGFPPVILIFPGVMSWFALLEDSYLSEDSNFWEYTTAGIPIYEGFWFKRGFWLMRGFWFMRQSDSKWKLALTGHRTRVSRLVLARLNHSAIRTYFHMSFWSSYFSNGVWFHAHRYRIPISASSHFWIITLSPHGKWLKLHRRWNQRICLISIMEWREPYIHGNSFSQTRQGEAEWLTTRGFATERVLETIWQ